MTIYRRFLLLIALLICVAIFLVSRDDKDVKSTQTSQYTSQAADRDVWTVTEDGGQMIILPDEPSSFQAGQAATVSSTNSRPFTGGYPKPPGSNYTKAVVLGRLLTEDTSWLDTATLPAHISKYIYHADHLPSTSQSFLSLPKPKGHEAMVYLTYIIEHYDRLADINIFLHAHQHAWHNNELLNHDALEMITRLSAERVSRDGYMNLRCHWKPGCPEYIHPHTTQIDLEKQEEGAMAAAWSVLFPGEELPDVLASPCCAQFAVSKARIRQIPLSGFVAFRHWLLHTELDDYVSGRVFEYLWHRIFTGEAVVCPDMRVCYCDGYGVCFRDDAEFDYWFELRWRKKEAEKKLAVWRDAVDLAKGKRRFGRLGTYKSKEEEEPDAIPAVDGDVVLRKEIDGYSVMLEERRLRALKAGTDPRVRAKVAGRIWKDGDGY